MSCVYAATLRLEVAAAEGDRSPCGCCNLDAEQEGQSQSPSENQTEIAICRFTWVASLSMMAFPLIEKELNMAADAGRYGAYYWCIKTPLSGDREIYLFADYLEVTRGILTAWRTHDVNGKQVLQGLMAFPRNAWSCYYAASTIDGHPVAVEHWKGEKND